jgi:hemerythrin-like domain-containing protein
MENELGALEFLAGDHRKMEALIGRLEKEGLDEGLIGELATVLHVHERIEEELFYPAVRAATKSKALIEGAVGDHQHLRKLLDERRLGELGAGLAAHIADEESHIFAAAERTLGRDRLDEMGRAMARRLEELAPRGDDGRRHEVTV